MGTRVGGEEGVVGSTDGTGVGLIDGEAVSFVRM